MHFIILLFERRIVMYKILKAEKLAERWNETENKMTLFLPKQGVSMLSLIHISEPTRRS